MDTTSLAQRMKEHYEKRARTYLTRRVPVIIRVDMKAGHTFCRGLKRPFDDGFIDAMNAATMYMVRNIQGVKCAYVQSDEISLLCTDYDKITTDAFFDYQVQKMCSVCASFAAGGFNREWVLQHFKERLTNDDCEVWPTSQEILESLIYSFDGNEPIANFDARVFNIPKHEVVNYFIWRMRDCEKNSISMVAQSHYSHKHLHKKNGNEMQEMLFRDRGINWNDFDSHLKRGRFITKTLQPNPAMEFYKNRVEKGLKVGGPPDEMVPRWKILENTPMAHELANYFSVYL